MSLRPETDQADEARLKAWLAGCSSKLQMGMFHDDRERLRDLLAEVRAAERALCVAEHGEKGRAFAERAASDGAKFSDVREQLVVGASRDGDVKQRLAEAPAHASTCSYELGGDTCDCYVSRRVPASAPLAVGDEVRLTRVGKITSWTGAATAPGHRTAGVSWGDGYRAEWLHESRIERVLDRASACPTCAAILRLLNEVKT